MSELIATDDKPFMKGTQNEPEKVLQDEFPEADKKEEHSSNKRIAKNTLFLYIRMLLTMVVSLYTSRVVLNALGVSDFGVYNVVGGVVLMFSVLSGSLSAAITRFITFELAKKDVEKLKRVFSTSVNIQILLSILIVLLIETVGVWFLNNKMVIPLERLDAAHWVLQFSIVTFVLNLLSVPYNATIIAHEKMSAFAYIGIVEVMLKLSIAFAIMYSPFDRLVYYGFLTLMVGLIIRLIYGYYCRKHFEEAEYNFCIDKDLINEMFSFAGWNFFGATSWQLMTQGVNLLLNTFFGVGVNAARGIASQVDNAIMQFVNSFTTAINPQIIKSYAEGNKEYLFSLVYRGAKFAYFLVLFFSVPLICDTDFILSLWLGNVPDYTSYFVKLTIVVTLIHVLSNSMVTAMLATGDIKKYQIIVGGLGMLVFPIAWLFFYLGYPPEMAYVSNIVIFIAQFVSRLILLREMIALSIPTFLNKVFVPSMMVTIASFGLPIAITHLMDPSLSRFLLICLVSVLGTVFFICFIGLDMSERTFVKNSIVKIFNKYHNVN